MEESADKIFVTPHAVIMLDGASAFVPVPVPAADYADHLGRLVAGTLTADPAADLPDVLAEAISSTAAHFDLHAGESPSSTVTIARERADHLDLLVLGDNMVILPDEIITDDRLARLNLEPRRRYRERLAAGHGYDNQHRRMLRELQIQQAESRNRDGGYWIAETDPEAARHALTLTRSIAAGFIGQLATDGAYNPATYLAATDRPNWSQMSRDELDHCLRSYQLWEDLDDPEGCKLPRAKRHDDKAVAVFIIL
ncbi:MAG TPA: hypothetical protein VJ870_00605 [Amycolatopsis sp.]|nr:hypothetical protein [Amycolatopsis sp.]